MFVKIGTKRGLVYESFFYVELLIKKLEISIFITEIRTSYLLVYVKKLKFIEGIIEMV